MNNQPSNVETNIAAIFVTRSLGAWAALNGILIVLSGSERWHSHTYDILNRMPGSPYTWGAIGILVGLCIIIGSISKIVVRGFSLRNFGLWATALWSLTFAVGFFASAAFNPISLNAPSTYLLMCILCIFMTRSRYTP